MFINNPCLSLLDSTPLQDTQQVYSEVYNQTFEHIKQIKIKSFRYVYDEDQDLQLQRMKRSQIMDEVLQGLNNYSSLDEQDQEKYKIISNKKKFIIDQIPITQHKRFTDELELIVLSDITEQQKTFKQQRINKDKSVFFLSIANDLRTHLNCISTNLDILNIEPSIIDDSKVQDQLELIHNSCIFLNNIIEDILDISKIEFNQLQLKKEWFNIFDAVKEITQLLSIQAEIKHINLSFNTSNDVPSHIFSDPKRIKQILCTLIQNAVKSTTKGFVKVRIQQYRKKDKVYLEFSVIDTGSGINSQDLQKLFKLFKKSKIMGNNFELGMTMCKRLISQLGGDISIQSQLNEGSTFSFHVDTGQKEGVQETGIEQIQKSERINSVRLHEI